MLAKISTARKLTIGMATYDDYHGVYFSIQAIRMFHKEVLSQVEFVIVDNNPDSEHGKAVKDFTKWVSEPIQYVPYGDVKSTSARQKVFEAAKTDYVLCMDCHIMLEPGSLAALIRFFDQEKDNGDLIQGPLLYDDLKNVATHFRPEWSDQMFGKWALDPQISAQEPFEIPMQGLGVFACRKSAWIGFYKGFKGFACEEFFIAEQHRQAGRKVICLPELKWVHRFSRPDKIPYPISSKDKYQNYIRGFKKLNRDISEIREHFLDYFGRKQLDEWENEVNQEQP